MQLVTRVDHQMYLQGDNTPRSKKGRGNNISERAALQPRLTGLRSTLALANSYFLLPPPHESFLPGVRIYSTGSYLGLNTLIKLVVFEAKRILVLLRPGTSHVAFLGAHRRNRNYPAPGAAKMWQRSPKNSPHGADAPAGDPEGPYLAFPLPAAHVTPRGGQRSSSRPPAPGAGCCTRPRYRGRPPRRLLFKPKEPIPLSSK